jgi:PIN domain
VRTNYVLIDFENVQPDALASVAAEHFKVKVFVGANQNKIAFETACVLQRMGDKAEYIKIAGNGSNALDFHIAYYIGRIAAEDPTAYFHIISKDTGFDPLIAHLKEKKIFAARSKDVTDIPLLKAANSKTTPEKIDVVVANLQQRGASKPRTLKTLTSTINSLFQKQLGESDLAEVLRSLEQQGFIAINEGKVSYTLPPA